MFPLTPPFFWSCRDAGGVTAGLLSGACYAGEFHGRHVLVKFADSVLGRISIITA